MSLQSMQNICKNSGADIKLESSLLYFVGGSHLRAYSCVITCYKHATGLIMLYRMFSTGSHPPGHWASSVRTACWDHPWWGHDACSWHGTLAPWPCRTTSGRTGLGVGPLLSCWKWKDEMSYMELLQKFFCIIPPCLFGKYQMALYQSRNTWTINICSSLKLYTGQQLGHIH